MTPSTAKSSDSAMTFGPQPKSKNIKFPIIFLVQKEKLFLQNIYFI